MNNFLKGILIVAFIALINSCNRQIKFPDGGYSYPASIYKNIRDSFNSAYYLHYWCLAYDEPDLSISPQKENTFRLIYETAFGGTTIFTLTPNQIAIKRALQGKPYPEFDTLKLNQLERLHFSVLKNCFPIQELDSSDHRKKMADSLSKIYPLLLAPTYYKHHLDKSPKNDSIPFKYSTKKVEIASSKYYQLINLINSSGFWKLPIHLDCDFDYTDGWGILLEANTYKKYNFVSLAVCTEKALKFCKACQAIIDASNLDKKISIVSEKN